MACPQEDSAPTGGIQGSLRNKTAPACTDGGLNFRLHGTVDQENLLHVAESLRIK